MHGFVEAGHAGSAERGRWQHADRAGQHRGLVRQDIAEQVACEDDVELLWRAHQFHGAGIGIHVDQVDTAAIFSMGERHFLPPEQAGFHDIRLFDRTDAAGPATGNIERHARDAFDFGVRVDRRIVSATIAFIINVDAARLAKIDVARQFANDHQVKTFDDLAFQARGIDQCGEAIGRAQVGKHVQPLAQGEKASLRTLVARHVCPFRPADRAQKHRISVKRLLQRIFGEGVTVQVKGRPADKACLELEVGHENFGHAARLRHDFGADAVTRQ